MAISNPQNPQDRRRGFVNRLYQQYQQGNAAGRAAPGMGTPFHAGIRSAPAIHTQMTNFDNIGAGVRNSLGVGGMGSHLPTDSGIPGREVAGAAPTGVPLPRPISLPLPGTGTGAPLPPSTASAPATTSGNISSPSPGNISSNPAPQTGMLTPDQIINSGSISPVGNQSNGIDWNAAVANVQNANIPGGQFTQTGSNIPGDAIPLGNGTFWSPTAGIITSGSQAGAGSAAAALGSGRLVAS